jgi:hypothetical protein
MLIQGQVGPSSAQSLQPGSTPAVRMGQQGDAIISQLHGRFYEQTYRGAVFSIGTTAIVALASTHATGTLTASNTPILGVWNPLGSGVNLVIAQAQLNCFINTVTNPVGAGAFIWAASVGNGSITTGLNPVNNRSLVQAGSAAKAFAGGTALTGLTNTLVAYDTADFSFMAPTPTYTTIGNTVLLPSVGGVQNFDGQLIVPPGGVLSLVNTTSTITMSFTGRLTWEEVPI